MERFSFWLAETINWNTAAHQTYTDQHTGKTHNFKVEYKPLSWLKPHEEPSRYRVKKMVKSMQSGSLPMISAGEDGTILDGHARYYAAVKIIGINGNVPVEIHFLS